MLPSAFHTIQIGLLGLSLLLSVSFDCRAERRCAMALLPAVLACSLSSLPNGSSWQEGSPAFVIFLGEFATLALLIRETWRHSNRLPLLLAAFGIIAVLAGLLEVATLGVERWHHRVISNAVWFVGCGSVLLVALRRVSAGSSRAVP
jgi:hypothetical protein